MIDLPKKRRKGVLKAEKSHKKAIDKHLRKYAKVGRFIDEGLVEADMAYSMIFNTIPGQVYLIAPESVINKVSTLLAEESDIDTLSEKIVIDRNKSVTTTKCLVSYEKEFMVNITIKDHSLVPDHIKEKFPNVYKTSNPTKDIELELAHNEDYDAEDDDTDFKSSAKPFSMSDFKGGLRSKDEDTSTLSSIAIYYKIGSKDSEIMLMKIRELVVEYEVSTKANKQSGIYLLTQSTQGGINKIFYPHKPMDIRPKVLYNEDLAEGYDYLVETIKPIGTKGLVLLTGVPGSGKSTMLKQLAKDIPEKDFIFIASANAAVLAEPGFLTWLLGNPNSVIIIEEAQNCLMDRTLHPGGISAVSNILNICDGLMSDALNIVVIASMNTSTTTVDKALLREGRLLCEMYFGHTSVEQANNICKEYKIEKTYTVADKEITLADIFCKKTYRVQKDKKAKIGFGK